MRSRGKVLVVGGGIAGLSTAWALTRRGYAVEVFEQGQIPNPVSSSYDEHRITRHAYGDFRGYARMMPDAFAAYERMFADIGARHIDAQPMLVLQREPISWFSESLRSLEELGVAHRHLDAAEVARRYPMLISEGVSAAFEADGAGVLFPIRILTDLVMHLAARGVVFHARTPVSSIDPERTSLMALGRVYQGDALVVAAGAWVTRLVPSLAGVAVPSRQAVVFVAPPRELAAAWASAPAILDLGAQSGTYTIPPRPGTRLKVGDHHFTRAGDPDSDRAATAADIERLMQAARLAYRNFDDYTMLEAKACFYTVTEDEHFIARPLGTSTYVLSACSGHGFKFGALIGEGMARTIDGECAADWLTGWADARLAA